MDAAHIRNFSIIAHIDHGKTTLSDRLLHRTGTIATRDMEAQLLDSMDLERERGITIKAHPVTMTYKALSGEVYELNLIDTPGHVDFSYEVSRSLSACEGALLIIDAAQGVEAQTVANVHLAMKQNLTIIPVINKIDLPHADVALAKVQLEDILAIPGDTAILASAKEGIGIEDILEAIVARIPSPKPSGANSLQALGFDSYFDTYKGVVTHVRVFNGELKAGMQVKLLHSGKNVEVKEVGSFNPKPYIREKLEVGETGYFTANIKSPKEVKMGDTVTDARNPSAALPGFQEIHPMVFSGIYPINTADYEHLKANLPPGTLLENLQSYAVLFHDIENATNKTPADTLHWSAFNIPGSAKTLPEGLGTGDLPDGTRNGPGIAASRPNGTPGYFGPGAGPGPFHHYVFEFYALDTKLNLQANATREDLLKAMEGHVIGKAAYVGRFHQVQ